MKNIKFILEILILLNSLFLIISKYIKEYKIVKRLTDIQISINLLHIFLIILIIIFAFLYNPKYLTKFRSRYRANRFYKNWIKLKNILINYKENKDTSLQKKYTKIIESLKFDYHFFSNKIFEIEKSLNKDSINLVMNNFENCFNIRDINKWEEKVRRNIPEELDCFDYLVIEIKEYYNN